MPLTAQEKNTIRQVIAESLRSKFATYEPKEKTLMPFHTRLLGKDRMALFSFIQSLNTTFGTKIYEPVAESLARLHFAHVERGKKSREIISEGAQNAINEIKNGLERGVISPNQNTEVSKIRAVCRQGGIVRINVRKADIYLVSKDGWHYPIDIKTAKPNIDGFEKQKENMLKWTATILYHDPQAHVGAMLGIPYNPYEPEEYKHWTIRGMIDSNTQIKVGKDFWNFLANKPVYEDLLDCFERVGIQMRAEIDEYFKRYGNKSMSDHTK